jgi:hypothetical protein
MKNLYLCFVIVLLTISCSTAGTVWDDSIPPEESAKVAFWQFDPTSFNGVPLKLGMLKFLTIPAGNTNFTGDVKWSDSGYNVKYIFRSEDASFSCNLEGGKEYTAWTGFEYDEENKVRVWGIFFYHDIRIVGNPPKKKLIAFIPFNPRVLSN